jgi:hypothetical protein
LPSRHSLRRYCPLRWTIELRAHSIRYSGHVLWFCHRQLLISQNGISFRIVWCQIHSHAPLTFLVKGAFLFEVIREYPAFPALHRSLRWIPVLLS